MRARAGGWRPQLYPCCTSREPSASRGDAAAAECDRIYAWEYLVPVAIAEGIFAELGLEAEATLGHVSLAGLDP